MRVFGPLKLKYLAMISFRCIVSTKLKDRRRRKMCGYNENIKGNLKTNFSIISFHPQCLYTAQLQLESLSHALQKCPRRLELRVSLVKKKYINLIFCWFVMSVYCLSGWLEACNLPLLSARA